MSTSHPSRGTIAPAVLLIAVAVFAGFAQGSRGAQSSQRKSQSVLPDPAAQRREMIASLKSLEVHLETMEKTLASMERIAGAQLRIQFEQQKAQAAKESPPTQQALPRPPAEVAPPTEKESR